MSQLMSRTQHYPTDLFSGRFSEDEIWWVLQTKPKCEKTLARILLHEQVSFFLPLGRTRKKYQRRWVESYPPLFPGYLFLRGTQDSRMTALMTNRVVTTLEVDDQNQLQQELISLFQILRSGQDVKAEPAIVEGDRVEIVKGALAGLNGIVVRGNSNFRLFVEVKMLGRSVSVQIENWMLRKY